MALALGLIGAATVYMALYLLGVLVLYLTGLEAKVEQLTAVAGTNYCEIGCEALKDGGPMVAAWRDLALTERSQLHVFDVEMMLSLGYVHRAKIRNAERRAQRDEACRELHGISAQG